MALGWPAFGETVPREHGARPEDVTRVRRCGNWDGQTRVAISEKSSRFGPMKGGQSRSKARRHRFRVWACANVGMRTVCTCAPHEDPRWPYAARLSPSWERIIAPKAASTVRNTRRPSRYEDRHVSARVRPRAMARWEARGTSARGRRRALLRHADAACAWACPGTDLSTLAGVSEFAHVYTADHRASPVEPTQNLPMLSKSHRRGQRVRAWLRLFWIVQLAHASRAAATAFIHVAVLLLRRVGSLLSCRRRRCARSFYRGGALYGSAREQRGGRLGASFFG